MVYLALLLTYLPTYLPSLVHPQLSHNTIPMDSTSGCGVTLANGGRMGDKYRRTHSLYILGFPHPLCLPHQLWPPLFSQPIFMQMLYKFLATFFFKNLKLHRHCGGFKNHTNCIHLFYFTCMSSTFRTSYLVRMG